MISEGCDIAGEVDFSVIFAGVKVEEGAIVRDSILMPGTVVRSGAVVEYAIVAENAVIESGAQVGMRPEDVEDKDSWGVTVIGEGVTVGAGAKVAPKAMVDADIPPVDSNKEVQQ